MSESGTGSGTVSGPGISCPGDCSQTYNDGALVSLSASPASSSSFAGWSGACAGMGGCQVTMDANKSATGSFASQPPPPPPPPPVQRTLTVSVGGSGSGTVSGTGISCPGDCTETYDDGTQVSLSASPGGTSTFGGWSGACSGTGGCQLTLDADKSASAAFNAAPPPPTCPLSQTGTPIGLDLSGCTLIASDTASSSDPRTFWGNVECGTTWGNPDLSRAQQITTGGDTHSTAMGLTQGNSAYRRLTVLDGDDYSGERCELGRNDHFTGPTAFYHEGQRRATFASLRLPSNFPLSTNTWQTVLQMKQAQPSDAGGGVPILFMGAYLGSWHIEGANFSNGIHTFPAQPGVWTRFAFDVYYSQDPAKGWLQVSADLNGDGDFGDSGERSPVVHAATLKTETDGPNGTSDGLAPGDPIPSHLRAGIYHNPTIACPSPVGCSTELDNVQVVAP